MLTQYLIAGRAPKWTLAGNHRVEKQRSSNTDVLAGGLDLPSGFLTDDWIERYLKLHALFFEHVLIPDGWLHCYGPVSEYLRRKLRQDRRGKFSTEFTGNVVFQLAKAGILVPVLRGMRPRAATDHLRGFNLYDVWQDGVLTHDGRISLGVHYATSRDRMMILHRDSEENAEIIRELSGKICVFADWTSPDIPVNAIETDNKQDLENWKHTFSAATHRLLLEDEEVTSKEWELLLTLLTVDTDRARRFREFAERLTGTISAEARSNDFRRGAAERVVGNYLFNSELTDFDCLRRFVFTGKNLVANRFCETITMAPDAVHPEALYAEVVLDRISTIQEQMFARKLNCSVGMPPHFSRDVLNAGLSEVAKFGSGVSKFSNLASELSASPIDFSTLTVDQICSLRSAHTGFFEALSKCKPEEDFWGANNDLLVELRDYLKDIDRACAASTTLKSLAVQAGCAVVSQGSSVVFVAQGAKLMTWIAEKAVETLGELIVDKGTSALGDWSRNRFQGNRIDSTLRLMGVPQQSTIRTDKRSKPGLSGPA